MISKTPFHGGRGRASATAGFIILAWACATGAQVDRPSSGAWVAELIRALELPSVSGRIEAARELGRLGPLAEVAIPELILVTANRDSELQATAAWALGEIGDATPETIGTLRGLIGSDVGFVAAAAVEALGKLGAEPVSENVVAAAR